MKTLTERGEMKTKVIPVHFCDHCNKLYQVKRACLEHEKVCKKNPANFRACFGCFHLEKRKARVFEDTWSGDEFRTVELLHCKKIDSFLYPPKVEYKKNWFELGDDSNEPMKKECEFSKSSILFREE